MKNQKIRSMKVHEQSGYNYKATPTIILKGQWLKEMGFEIGDYITVSCEDGKLVITPDAEKAAMAKAEAEFMEKGMSLKWNRNDDVKSSKIYCQLDNVSIENEIDWLQMARFHAEWSKKFYDVIVPYLLK